MNTLIKKTAAASAVAIALCLSVPSFAAETSSAMRGKIVSQSGEPISGVKVTITHVPSGSVKHLTANEAGVFLANGLRVGGPYKVEIDSDVYQDQEVNNLFLQLGKVSRVDVSMQIGQEVERIGVVGSRHALINGSKNGIGSVYGAEAINNAPAFDRDLKDILRQNPLINISDDSRSEMSVAGVNPRFNSISVDGVKQNDDFGLSSNGYPTNGSPISLLAIDQISVDIAPFNAKASGFTGASINAVTKSGGNEFTGEVFYDYSSDSLAGTPKREDGTDVDLDFSRKTYGIAVGGPLIEDTLFFFAAFEKSETPFVHRYGPEGASTANIIDGLDKDTINDIQKIARDVYGVEAGVYGQSLTNEDKKILLKLDWNINDDHRASFTYQNTTGNSISPQNTKYNKLGLSSHWYNNSQDLKAYSAQLYSTWTDEFSTEFKVGLKSNPTRQENLGQSGLGQVCINIKPGNYCGDELAVYFGTDVYRHANELDNDALTINLNGEYLFDEHSLSFGIGLEKLDVFNKFVPFSLGSWEFDSVEDFQNKKASKFSYSNAYTGNSNDASAEFTIKTLSLFVEDKWEINSDFWLNVGVRYEKVSTSGLIRENGRFKSNYDFGNTETLDGIDIVLPRIGFNWLIEDNLTLSGGIGRYYGGTPNVWISNSYSNDGQINVRANTDGVDLTNPVFDAIPAGTSLQAGNGDVNAIDPNFKLPSDWRVGLTLNYTADLGEMLGDDWNFETSYMYVKAKSSVVWKELYRESLNNSVEGPDGRTIYNVGYKDVADILLTNGGDAKRKTFTLSAGKLFDNGVRFNASYANQDADEVVGGTSSTANSNYAKYNASDRNNPIAGTSRYQIEHSFKLNLSYNTEIFDGLNSRFSLQGERSSGRSYSWVFENGFGAFGGQDNFKRGEFLAYIPTGADDSAVTYTDGYSYEMLKEVIDANDLGKYAGSIVPKNSASGPWVSRLDFKFEQEIPGFADDHKGTFFVSVKNLLNLIDSSAGKVYTTDFKNSRDLVNVDYDRANNQYIYGAGYDATKQDSGFADSAPTSFDAERSAWRIKVGVSYKF
ncbi:MAG: TonB-dependent receptor [Gammaproteobacteria bacterium]|nr:TonB-dependent receptor [Gammaproteobacteria bacterium]